MCEHVSLFLVSSVIFGSLSSAAQAGSAPDSVEPAKRDYRFEVASIRPSGPPTGYAYGDPRLKGPTFIPGGLYREEAETLANMAGEAFGIKHSYQMEAPRWMGTDYFTLNATVPEGATKADLPIMFRHLLEDRFALKFHHETRQMSGYELVVVKSGVGLTKSAGPPSQRRTTGPPVEFGKDGMPHIAKDVGSIELHHGANAEWHGRNETMQQMVDQLVVKLDVPVMDATGLEGAYDFTLLYTPEYNGVAVSSLLHQSNSDSSAGGGEASVPMEHPLLRDALREQLGLELKPVKNVTVDVVVLDGANKEPTEN